MSTSSSPWDDPDTDPRSPGLPDATEASEPDRSADVMASVDVDATRERSAFVIADVSREDAWISVDEDDAPLLEEWR